MTGPITITARAERFPLARAFVISRGAKVAAEVVTVTAERSGFVGRGEGVPYARYGETVESVLGQLSALPVMGDTGGPGWPHLPLPPGAARNALDCALADLAAKEAGVPLWQLRGLAAPGPLVTAFTLSLGTPAAMAAEAREQAGRPVLKIKLGTPDDLPRLRAVRQGAPGARIIVDANEGWTAADYAALAPALQGLGVALVEQPLPAGQDAALRGLPRPVPVCADESCHTLADLPGLAGKYDMVNIKLDKAGGLGPALALRDAARAQRFGVMVGCMVGTSLAMAPAVLLAQGAEVVDLDGPLLLAADRADGLSYEGSIVQPPGRALWG